jgi:hypothetical protein
MAGKRKKMTKRMNAIQIAPGLLRVLKEHPPTLTRVEAHKLVGRYSRLPREEK